MSTQIYSRSMWGAQYADGDLDLYGLAEDIAVHHTVTHADGSTPAAERAHMLFLEGIGQSRFRHGISYNVLVFPSGRAYQGVSFSRRGSHTGGHNSTVRSVCFVGNFEHDTPTPAAIDTAAAIIAEGRGELWRRDARVLGHRDFKGTDCPGDHLYARLADLAAGPTTTEDDDMSPEIEQMIRDLHAGTAPKVDMPWKDETGRPEKYTVRSALKWIADKVKGQ